MSSRTVACRRCGALNEPDFGACIRCGASLQDADPAAGARRVPARRTRGRAPPGTGTEPLFGKIPAEQLPVAKVLVTANAIVFAAQVAGALSRGSSMGSALLASGGAFEAFLFGALPMHVPALVAAEPYRLLASCFVHYGVLHVFMNMSALVYLGRVVEPFLGSIRFAIAYLLAGFGGMLLAALWGIAGVEQGMVAGASGAIFGLEGIMMAVAVRRGNPAWKRRLGELLVFSIILGFMLNISHAAHLGGFLAGFGAGWAFERGAPKPSRRWQRWSAALLVVVTLASIVAPRFSPSYDVMLRKIEQDRLEREFD